MLQYKSMSKGNIYKATREERETFVNKCYTDTSDPLSIPR